MAKHQTAVPGAPEADTASVTTTDSPEVAALKAKLAEAEAKLEAADSAAKLPQVVYEPVTPKGAEAMANNANTVGMTSKQLLAKIKAGELTMPTSAVLCADGYFCPR